jgi:hypothetical protein
VPACVYMYFGRYAILSTGKNRHSLVTFLVTFFLSVSTALTCARRSCRILIPKRSPMLFGRFSQAGVRNVVVIAVTTEWLATAFRSAIRANRDSTVRTVSNGELSAADRISVSVRKFDQAARASHNPTPHRLGRNRASLGLVRCAVPARIIRAFRSSANIADSGFCTKC